MYKKSKLYSSIALTALGSLPLINFSQAESSFTLEELIVTASRRSQTVQDIPYNITAVTGDNLSDVGATSLSSMAQVVPGLQIVDVGARGSSLVTLRGMNIGGLQAAENQGANNVVSRYINDSPISVDVKLIDVERVEVLRGPQGTLYGRGAMGGTIRYIINIPNSDAVEGQVYSKLYQNAESDGLSYEVTGILNLPLTDTLAARFSGSYLDEEGFEDYNSVLVAPGVSNDTRKVKDANDEEATSFRASLRWEPSYKFIAQANYFLQDQSSGGRRASNENFTGSEYASASRYLEPGDVKDQLFSLEIDAVTDYVDIFSTTSVSKSERSGRRDQTDLLVVDIFPGYADFPEFSAFTSDVDETDVLIHETRIQSNTGEMFDWMVGVYYEDEDFSQNLQEFTPGYQDWGGFDTGWGELEFQRTAKRNFEEKAVFGELTVHFTDDFQVTAGYRDFKQTLEVEEDCVVVPIFWYFRDGGVTPVPECQTGKASVSDGVAKLNASWDITEDILFYSTWAEGFRRGGVNLGPNLDEPSPGASGLLSSERSYNPDKATSTELGWHATFVDGRITLNGSIFQVDWEELQVPTKSQFGGFNIISNGEKGEIKGLELTLQAHLSDSLRLDAWVTSYDTELSEDASGVNGLKGDSFPGVPKLQYNIALEYRMDMGGNPLTFRGNYYWKDEVATQLNATEGANVGDYALLDDYGLLNLSASYELDQWRYKLYASNVANKYYETGARGETRYGQRGGFRYVGTPRVIGLEVGYSF